MAKIKLTKTAVETAQPQAKDVELRDTVVPGFLCKITPAGRRVFMLQYRTNAGQSRKPSLGLYGELTVEQARVMAQDWLAEVRRGGDPGGAKAEARKAPTMAELCKKFMEDYSKKRNKPSTWRGYPTRTVWGVPRLVNLLRMEARTCSSVTCRSKSLAITLSPSLLKHPILVSTRLRRW